MAKHRSHRRRSHSKSRTMKGGALAGNPASSWGWGMGTLGNGWTQFMNSLTLQPGQSAAAAQSNNIVPNSASAPVPQNGGRRRRHKRSNKRGGNIAAVLSQAAVPGVLLVAQQTYGKSRKHRRH